MAHECIFKMDVVWNINLCPAEKIKCRFIEASNNKAVYWILSPFCVLGSVKSGSLPFILQLKQEQLLKDFLITHLLCPL